MPAVIVPTVTRVSTVATGLWSIANRLARQVTYFGYAANSSILPSVSAALAAGEGRVDVFARLDVHGEAAHDAEHAGARGEGDGHEDVELVGLNVDETGRIEVEHQPGV